MAEAPIQIRGGSLKLVEYPFPYREDDLLIVKTVSTYRDITQVVYSLEVITNVLVGKEEVTIRAKSATLPPEANAQSRIVLPENRFYPVLLTGVDPFDGKTQGKFTFYLAPDLLLEQYRDVLKHTNTKNNRVDAILSSNKDNSNGKVDYYIGKITDYR
jgi:hypothetical protein